MSFEDALKKLQGGVIIEIDVSAGSKSPAVPSGYNPWRKRVEVRLSHNAQKGKANEELIYKFARLFDLKLSDVIILNGLHNSKKTLLFENIDYYNVFYVLNEILSEK